MIKKDIDLLSEYYQSELSYLRSAGRDFSIRFPKIARRLDLSENESSDPHIERMIESFAFLTGKLQKQIDDQFPEVAKMLLDVIYQPLDVSRAAKAPGFVIQKDTQLQTVSYSGETCFFRTAHDIAIWPIKLLKAEVVSKEDLPGGFARALSYLKLNLEYAPAQLMPSQLRFYIFANALLKSRIYAAIFSSTEKVIFQKGDVFLFTNSVRPVGVEKNESLLPYPNSIHQGFRLLHEYFAFSEKFYGFDVDLPQDTDFVGQFSLYIPLDNELTTQISHKNFSLSSVPAVNLFSKITEPLRLDYRQVDYCLVPDYQRYRSHEIYSIEKLVMIDPKNNDEILVPEFFSYHRHDEKLLWLAKRKRSYMKDLPGEDIHLSFVDMDFNPQQPADKIFYAYTLCTNRYLAEQIPAMGALQMDISAPVSSIYCVDHPTSQKLSMSEGSVLWKLISLLSLNSFSFNESGMSKLKDLLAIFSDMTSSQLSAEIDALVDVDCNISSKRILKQAWHGFVPGVEVNLTFEENLANLGLPLSLAISQFLSMYTTINTYTDVIVKNTNKNRVVRTWARQFGNKNYL